MNKILLIRTDYASPLSGYTMPLGIMYLSSYVKKNCPNKYQIQILSTGIENMDNDTLIQYIESSKPELVGFSSLNCDIIHVSDIVRRVKEKNPQVITVIGGPLATSAPEELLKCSKCDYVVIGEGEKTFLDLLKFFDKAINLEKIDGLGYIRDGEVIINKNRAFIEDLDSLEFPDYSRINFAGYWRVMNFSGFCEEGYATIMTSRGCPYKCVYCFDVLGKKFRARTPENILQEIKHLKDNYGIKKIHIVDDIFNFDRKRTERILDLIIEGNLNIGLCFPNGLRSDLLDKDILRKFKKAGTYFMVHALETASERLQKKIQKNLNLKKIKENITICCKLEILTRTYAMLGFPDETKAEVLKTIEFIKNSDVDCADFFKVTPIPGTKIFDSITDQKENISTLNQMYYFSYNKTEISSWRLIPDDELNKLHEYAYLSVNKMAKRQKRKERLLKQYSMINNNFTGGI